MVQVTPEDINNALYFIKRAPAANHQEAVAMVVLVNRLSEALAEEQQEEPDGEDATAAD